MTYGFKATPAVPNGGDGLIATARDGMVYTENGRIHVKGNAAHYVFKPDGSPAGWYARNIKTCDDIYLGEGASPTINLENVEVENEEMWAAIKQEDAAAEGESYTEIEISSGSSSHWVNVGPYSQEYDLDDAVVYSDTLDGKTIAVNEAQSVDSALKSFFDNYTDYSALPVPKAVSLDNLQTFKEKCDEIYAPMSRALPAPAGTTDTGKVPTVNGAGNGYELQMPSGGGAQLYNHYISCTVTGIGITSPLRIYFNFISTSGTVLTDTNDLAEAIKNQFLSCKGNLAYSDGSDSAIPIYITSDGSNIFMGYITQGTNNSGEVPLTSLATFHFSDSVNEV